MQHHTEILELNNLRCCEKLYDLKSFSVIETL